MPENLSVFLFPLYALAHLCIVGWSLYLWRVHKAPGAPIVAMISAGLVYDNTIISIGASLDQNLLKLLSYPRFYLHGLLTPFMMIAATQMAVAGGIRWAESKQWQVSIWTLVIAMVALGAYEHALGIEIYPACDDGIVRFTQNLYPSQFCSEDAVAVKGAGAPIPSIIGNFIALVVGFFLWRHNGWIWLMAGSLVMFAAASLPFSIFGMAPGNGGEVLLMASYVFTVWRFGCFRKRALGTE